MLSDKLDMTPAVRRHRDRPPQQARSAATLERLLDAAEFLLQTRSFDSVTVTEIATAAAVTIGAFYARFEDKEAILTALEDRLTAVMVAYVGEATDPERWSGITVEEGLRRYCLGLADIYRRTRGAGRALVLRSHTDSRLQRRLHDLNVRALPRMLSFIMAQPGVTHEQPALAVEVVLLTIRSFLRETILFSEAWPGEGPLAPDVLAAELARLCVGYLGSSASAVGRAAS